MVDLQAVEPGWTVYGGDRAAIGSVRHVGRDYLEVEKGTLFVRDLYIPASAVADLDAAEHRVVLKVSRDAVGDLGWTNPPFDTASGRDGGGVTPSEGEPPDTGYYGTWDDRELDATGQPARPASVRSTTRLWGQGADDGAGGKEREGGSDPRQEPPQV